MGNTWMGKNWYAKESYIKKIQTISTFSKFWNNDTTLNLLINMTLLIIWTIKY